MNMKDELLIVGRSRNNGLPFDLTLEVVETMAFNRLHLVGVMNPLNNDIFIIDLEKCRIFSDNNAFYSDCFDLYNITNNIKVI